MRVNRNKFFIALLIFLTVIIGMGIREYYDTKSTRIETIKSNLQDAVSSASIIVGNSYYDHLSSGKVTPVEMATMSENMTSLSRIHGMQRLYSVYMDANNTLRYAISNVFASSSNQTLIHPLNAVIDDREQLTKILKSNQPYFQLDKIDGSHAHYVPNTTASGIHTLTIAVTEPTSLQKISQMAIFDTIAKSLLIFAGILPFLILYRNTLSQNAERLSEKVESTTEKLENTTEILHQRVEEKTKELINEGFIDPLTHLPNRHRLAFDMDRHTYHALVIIHLKNLQELNHFFGPSITDSLRQQVALLLTKLGLITYRLGRDEFAILLDSDTTIDLPAFAEFLLHSLNEHSFNVLNEKVIVAARLGIDTSAHLSLSHANEALSDATETSQDFSIYEEDNELEKHQHQNLTVASSIREAYYDGRIICYYQPIVATHTGKIMGYETLARLISKEGTLLLPLEFLTVAKKTALYPEISREIVRQTCEAFAYRDENFSVHICALDMMDSHTVHYIEECLVSTDTAHRVIFELSEEDIYNHYLPVSHFVTRIKRLGAKISIDNFGSDYSSLNKILHLDIDYIKIDGGLINKVNLSQKYLETIRTIAIFAKAIGAKSIAENVENDEIFTLLQTLNIDYVQGFHIGSPSHLP